MSESLPYIPGVGPAMEALNWATGESRELRPGNRPVSEVFEGEQALYVVRLDSYAPAGTMTVQEATPQIRETLILEKKKARAKAEGEKIVAAVRGGQTLQQAASARGLQVATLGPFSRMDANPTFGAGSAAVGAAFGTPLNQASGVIDSPAGLFIVRPTARTTADQAAFAREKEQIRMGVTQQLAQQALNRWLDSARKSAKITDNREKILRGA